jgi:hypothetical protein
MRDPQRQNRYQNSFKVSYPDFPSLTNTVRSIVIHQEMGKHDIVEIYYPMFSSKFFKLIKTGVPVQITWKTDKAVGKFIGYTVEVTHQTAQQFMRGVKVVCIGASYPLKERSVKIWKNKTATEIATEIAKKFKLQPVITPSSIRFSQQSLSGHSYWEKLNELALNIGYGVQVIGSELHFHPIDKMINQFMTIIPIMSFQNPLEHPVSQYVGPTLELFEPRVGDHNELLDYSRSDIVVGGIDPVTGKTYLGKSSSSKVSKKLRSSIKDPLFTSVETRTVVASNAMAKSLANARAELGRFSIVAHGQGQGDPRISPWRTLEVKGTGATTDGFWVVKKAEHVIHGDGRYAVEFTCLSDGTGANKGSAFRPTSASFTPSRNVANELAATKKKPTSTKLSSKASMIKETSGGYIVTPRRWEGM